MSYFSDSPYTSNCVHGPRGWVISSIAPPARTWSPMRIWRTSMPLVGRVSPAARLQRLVPGESEILAVDLSSRLDAAARHARRILGRECRPFDTQDYLLRHSADGEIARHLVAAWRLGNTLRLELDHRIVRRV